eukprot:6007089-Lingulodinium_polyedra.AAC.1
MRGSVATECVSERVSEQVSHESCAEMRSETHSIPATMRVSQNSRCVRPPPLGGRRAQRAFLEMRGTAAMECVSER